MRRTPTRRVEENFVNEDILPKIQKVEKVLQGTQGDQGSRDAYVPIMKGSNDVLVVPPETTNGEIK